MSGTNAPDASVVPLALEGPIGFVGVALAYYLGAQIGFAFQSPEVPQSVLWLPNSILLATLLLVPLSRWPLYLAAAFPAQLLVAWQTEAPVLAMSLLFATNCLDAALGAFLVRRLVDGPFRFVSLKSTTIFAVLAATVSPVLLSFADAAISVFTGWAPAYWAAFSTRVHSNVLTHLIVVPALVQTVTLDFRRLNRANLIEGVVFSAALLVVSVVAFMQPAGSGALTVMLYLPLPLLFWAAVRFGPGGTGWSVLAVALVASWEALHGRGPFNTNVPEVDVKALQLFLLSISAPLLFLSATITERNLTMSALRDNESSLRHSLARVQDLTGKLIAAQELERMRIARDLHDDVSQRLAALSIGLSNLRSLHGTRADAEIGAISSLQAQATALVEGVREMSHDLHVGALDAGLASALRAHCAEFGRQHQIAVSCRAHGDIDAVPHDVAITVYRIVQEALRNVFRHAGVLNADVTVTRSASHLELQIVDRGRGFDIAAGRRGGGLGLLSIEERTKFVGGAMTIDTRPGHGTALRVAVPLRGTDEPSPGPEVAPAVASRPETAAGDARPPRVLLADDHKIVVEGLRHMLRDCCEIVGTVSDGPSLVTTAVELQPDIVVADISMPGFGGLEAIKRLKQCGVTSKVIVLTMHMDHDIVSAVMASGAAGYVPKHVAGQELVAAIRRVSNGETHVTLP